MTRDPEDRIIARANKRWLENKPKKPRKPTHFQIHDNKNFHAHIKDKNERINAIKRMLAEED